MKQLTVSEGERVSINGVVHEYCGETFCEVPKCFRCGALNCDCPVITRAEIREKILEVARDGAYPSDIAFEYNADLDMVESVAKELLAEGKLAYKSSGADE